MADLAARIALLSTSDTDLLSARASGMGYTWSNPSRASDAELRAATDGASLVVVRLLGSPHDLWPGLSAVREAGTPLVILGGEQQPNAELMELSTVPMGVAAQAHRYLAEGGPANLAQLHAFLSDTVLLTGEGFEPPAAIPAWGYSARPAAADASGPRVGVLYYRAHEASGNSGFAHALADALDATGEAVGVPVFAGSLRAAPAELYDALASLDALVVTVLAAGGTIPATASAGGDDEAWDVERMAALDIPVLQGLCLTSSRADWEASSEGVTPLDSASQIAIPEFDGRLITVPFSFKEIDADGLPRYVANPERCRRVARIAVGHARLQRVPNPEKKLALVLSAYPTRHARIGNAVGLDTPLSAIRLLRRLRDAGYDLGDGNEVTAILDGADKAAGDDSAAGDALIHALTAAGGQDEEWLTSGQLTAAHVRITKAEYDAWTADLPDGLRDAMTRAWGPSPGSLFVNDDGELVVAALRAGNIVILIQPPRGFGKNPVAVDPRAVPSRLAWQTGQAMADSLLRRYLDETGAYPASVGLSVWGTSAMRTSGDDIAEALALLGVRPEWDEASRRVSRLVAIPPGELGRPRIDVTVRISGFFRDAFPHVIAMLDDAVRTVAARDEPAEQNFVRAHAQADLAAHGDERRATIRVFGSKPGSYGAGILQAIESGSWRDDADLAEVYTAWGGFAYGRGLDGAPAADDMRASYRRIKVAAKNVDSAEHDIADSDDYFQYHGGMIATIRALTGADPKAYVGDSTSPDAVRTRTLAEETARVFRARVVNPRWIAAMRRHGYKGAFELAATVDYLFGFDATAGVVQDWMYDKLAREYVLDETSQDFLRRANPWALRGIVERLHEAAERGLWAEPDPVLLAAMQAVYLAVEGDLEERGQ